MKCILLFPVIKIYVTFEGNILLNGYIIVELLDILQMV